MWLLFDSHMRDDIYADGAKVGDVCTSRMLLSDLAILIGLPACSHARPFTSPVSARLPKRDIHTIVEKTWRVRIIGSEGNT